MPRYDNIPEIAPNLDGSGLRVGVVMCRFNLDVCEGLLSACTAELLRLGVAADAITIATRPSLPNSRSRISARKPSSSNRRLVSTFRAPGRASNNLISFISPRTRSIGTR